MFVREVAYYYRWWRPGAAMSVFDTRWAAMRSAWSQARDDRAQQKLDGEQP